MAIKVQACRQLSGHHNDLLCEAAACRRVAGAWQSADCKPQLGRHGRNVASHPGDHGRVEEHSEMDVGARAFRCFSIEHHVNVAIRSIHPPRFQTACIHPNCPPGVSRSGGLGSTTLGLELVSISPACPCSPSKPLRPRALVAIGKQLLTISIRRGQIIGFPSLYGRHEQMVSKAALMLSQGQPHMNSAGGKCGLGGLHSPNRSIFIKASEHCIRANTTLATYPLGTAL